MAMDQCPNLMLVNLSMACLVFAIIPRENVMNSTRSGAVTRTPDILFVGSRIIYCKCLRNIP